MAKRRAAGEGTIFQRSDGRWAAQVTSGYDANGKRKYKTVTAKTQGEVKNKLKEMVRRQDQGLQITPDRLTVEKFLEDWLDKIKSVRSPNTYRARETVVRMHLKPAFGKTPLTKLSVPQVQKLLNRLADEGRSRNYIDSVRSALRNALKDAQRQGIVTINAASLAEMPKNAVPPRERKGYSPDEARQLLQAIKGHRFEAPITVMLSLGLRRGEAFALTWANVDFDREEVRVVYNLQKDHDMQWALMDVKTAGSRKTVPLTPNLVQLLKRHKAELALHKRIAGEKWEEHGLVFPGPKGKPVSVDTFADSFDRLLKKHGLPRLTPHELRHSCASLLFAQGVDPKRIQEILRHSKLATTMDIYTHLIEGTTRDALTGMDNLIGGVG